MIAITGAAGFIGSVTAWKLNQLGREDLLSLDVACRQELQAEAHRLQGG